MIYLNLDLATIAQEDSEGVSRNTIRLIQYLLERSDRNFQILVFTTYTNRRLSNEVIVSIENVEALKSFQTVLIPQVTSPPWITNSDLKIWQLVSPVIFQGNSLQFVPTSKDSYRTLQEIITYLEDQKRIEVQKWNIHSSALMLDKGLKALPECSVKDNDFLKRVATANRMLGDHNIDYTEIGSGVSHASTVESASENVVGYRLETLSLEDLHAEYAALYQLFRAMTDNPPADEQAPE